MALSEYLARPLLLEAAIAALFTCLGDAGGPIQRRAWALAIFGLTGAALTVVMGAASNLPLPLLLAVGAAALFVVSGVRVYGQQAMQIGNLLSVVVVLALDAPTPFGVSLQLAGAFLAGSLWALLLTMVIWRLHPYQPARQAVAESYRRLGGMAGDMRELLRAGADPARWEQHARTHRRGVRETIELARGAVLDTVRIRGPVSGRASQSLLRVETADQLFGALIALSELLETVREPVAVAQAERLLRLLRPLLTVLADAAEHDRTLAPARLGRTIAEIAAAGAALPAPLPGIAEVIVERLHIAATLSAPGNYLPGGVPDEAAQPWRDRLRAPLRANLTWQSASLRHAARVAVMAVPALAITHIWVTDYGHWLTFTTILTLQPFFAATWQRAVERIGGTVLGGLIAAALAAFVHTQLVLAAAIFPLTILTFAVRPVSYGLMITFLTPMVVLLMEIVHTGSSEVTIAYLRALYTLVGGLLALFGCLVLWPSWEPQRLRQELLTAIAAHARWADAELGLLLGETDSAAVDQARRAAGLASNNLEASLSRTLQEPRPTLRLEEVMVVDAALRRLAGRLSAMQLDPQAAASLAPEAWRRWRAWLPAALRGLAQDPPAPLPPRPEAARPQAAQTDTLARIARQVELMDGAMRRLA